MDNSTLMWVVLMVGTVIALYGGFELGRNLPKISPIGIFGEVVTVVFFVALILYLETDVLMALALPVASSIGTMLGLQKNPDKPQ